MCELNSFDRRFESDRERRDIADNYRFEQSRAKAKGSTEDADVMKGHKTSAPFGVDERFSF
jgi:hypothetical protein